MKLIDYACLTESLGLDRARQRIRASAYLASSAQTLL